MRKIKFLSVTLGILAIFCGYPSCTVEDLDLDKLDTDSLYLQTALDVPVAQVSANIKEIVKHKKSKGIIITPDTTFTITDELRKNVKLPIVILKGTYVEEKDSFTGLRFYNKVGEGRAIEHVEQCILKIEVDNGMPLDIYYKLTFYHKDTINNTLEEITELRKEQSFTANPAKLNESNHTTSNNTITKHKITYDKSFMPSLELIDQINVEYKFSLEEYDQTILTDKNMMKMKIACFFKGGILINEYDF
ncbi:MAG: hypothetical protein J6T28_08305 [Paludibacteraceae bacterium]|nr:hypothetical protein [Paludibacteraceae bacterium]MBP5480494.1 hypothetical protein [Paludibacteraceae bacterium]